MATLCPWVHRILLLTKRHNVGLYARCGFALHGVSDVCHGAETWMEMGVELTASHRALRTMTVRGERTRETNRRVSFGWLARVPAPACT